MASALEELTNNYRTDSPVSFADYYDAYYRDQANDRGIVYSGYHDPNSLYAKFDNIFSGIKSSAEQQYQNYLSGYEEYRNRLATAAANKETYEREDSQVQRLLADYQKAGLNPYLLASGGNVSSGVVSSQAVYPTYKKSSAKDRSDKSSSTLTSALKVVLMLAALALK